MTQRAACRRRSVLTCRRSAGVRSKRAGSHSIHGAQELYLFMGLSLLLVDLVQPVEDGGCRASSWFACKIMTDRAAVRPLRALELRMERTLTKFVPVRVSVDGLPGPGPHVTDQWLTTAGEMIHDYWWDISGGREDVQWRLYPDVVLPSNQPAVGPAELILAVRDIAVKMGAPFQDDEHLIVIMDHPASNLGVTETDPLIAAKDVDVALICHEMGHFYQRLNHQPTGHADSFSPFRPLEYDDPTCIMGAEHSLDGGGKYSFQDPGMAIAGSPGHDDVGPGMCPPMTAATGWLDEHDPLAVTDVTHSLPIDVQIDVWTGAPAARLSGSFHRDCLRRYGSGRGSRVHIPEVSRDSMGCSDASAGWAAPGSSNDRGSRETE